MAVELHDDCRFDYIEIFNGYSVNSPSIGRYCGSTLPDPLLSQSKTLRIEWHSDGSESDTGFKINYRFVSQGLLELCFSYYRLAINRFTAETTYTACRYQCFRNAVNVPYYDLVEDQTTLPNVNGLGFFLGKLQNTHSLSMGLMANTINMVMID